MFVTKTHRRSSHAQLSMHVGRTICGASAEHAQTHVTCSPAGLLARSIPRGTHPRASQLTPRDTHHGCVQVPCPSAGRRVSTVAPTYNHVPAQAFNLTAPVRAHHCALQNIMTSRKSSQNNFVQQLHVKTTQTGWGVAGQQSAVRVLTAPVYRVCVTGALTG